MTFHPISVYIASYRRRDRRLHPSHPARTTVGFRAVVLIVLLDIRWDAIDQYVSNVRSPPQCVERNVTSLSLLLCE